MTTVPSLHGAHLHFDCVSGIAGDMTVAALIDLGVPVEVIAVALDAVGAGRERLTVRRVLKHGIAAVDVQVSTELALQVSARGRGVLTARGAQHSHQHHHYRDIRARLVAAELTEGTRARALDMFDRIAVAEARLHGSTVDDVAFHEVGAIDSIVDVVGTAAALDWLAPGSVSCSSVAVGQGELKCAHGVLPVPAPAALEILLGCGAVVTSGNVARELCTPTGAAILASAVTTWTAAPAGTPLAVGWGAGDADLADRANVLRVTASRLVDSAASHPEAMWRLEANIDDMSPELCGPALDAVFAAGAVDAWWTPITMKKGRPALLFCALATTSRRAAVMAAMLFETTTIGVRFDQVERLVLERELLTVRTAYGPIAVKVARDGLAVRNVAPEHNDCVAAARLHSVPVKVVYAAAICATGIAEIPRES